MQDIKKEVISVLSQILENVCLENVKAKKLESERNFPLFMNKACDEYFSNFNHDEYKQSLIIKAFQENCDHVKPAFDSLPSSWEEPVNKCNIFYAKKADKFKDVFVQTIFYKPVTTDSQCQCDLISADGTVMALLDDREKKEIKLNNHCYPNIYYGKTHYQFQASEMSLTGSQSFDNKTNYSDSHKKTSILRSDSRLRIGLSKRFKPLSLHKR